MRDDEGESIVIIARTCDQRRSRCCGLRRRGGERKMKSVISYLNVIRRVCDLSVNVKPSEAFSERNEKILGRFNYLWCFRIIPACVVKIIQIVKSWGAVGLLTTPMWLTRVKAKAIRRVLFTRLVSSDNSNLIDGRCNIARRNCLFIVRVSSRAATPIIDLRSCLLNSSPQ